MVEKIRYLKYLAFSLMGIGTLFFIIPFIFSEISIDFSFNLAELSKLGQLGSYLSGTAGIFITLASVILVYISLSLSINALSLQQEAQYEERKNQSLRDFESLFFNLCDGISYIKSNNPIGLEELNNLLEKVLTRFPYDRKEIEEDAKSGDLLKQLQEENFIEVCDSFILYVSQIITVIDSRLACDHEPLKSFYFQQLSYRLSKEELRLLELVKMTNFFEKDIITPLSKLNFRNYNLSIEESSRKQKELRAEAEGWERLAEGMRNRRKRW